MEQLKEEGIKKRQNGKKSQMKEGGEIMNSLLAASRLVLDVILRLFLPTLSLEEWLSFKPV